VLAQYGVAALSLAVLAWRQPTEATREPAGQRPLLERRALTWAALAFACTAWLASYAEGKELLSMLAVELVGVGLLLLSRRMRADRAA
jgi:hypothetical protein